MKQLKTLLIIALTIFQQLAIANPKVNIDGLYISDGVNHAINDMVVEIKKMPINKNINILIKEGDGGIFKNKEWVNWAKKNNLKNKSLNWKKDIHGAKVVGSNDDEIYCVVYVPKYKTYTHKNGAMPMEWIVWHEMSHCLWPVRTIPEKWLSVPASAKEFSEMQDWEEESWADGWALAMSKKYLNMSGVMVFEWMKTRTADAIKSGTLDHWTNPVLYQIFGMKKNDYVWETVAFAVDEVVFDIEEYNLAKNILFKKPVLMNEGKWFDQNVNNFSAIADVYPF